VFARVGGKLSTAPSKEELDAAYQRMLKVEEEAFARTKNCDTTNTPFRIFCRLERKAVQSEIETQTRL
jgi:hypothetical protein